MKENTTKNNIISYMPSFNSKNTNHSNNITIDKFLLEEQLKCDLCNNFYDSTTHIPFVVKCGHTFCKQCIINTNNSYHSQNKCPIDSIKNVFNLNTSIRNIKIEFLVQTYLNIISSTINSKNNQIVYVKPEIKNNRSPSIKHKARYIYENEKIRGKSNNNNDRLRKCNEFQFAARQSFKFQNKEKNYNNIRFINKDFIEENSIV